MLKVRTKPMEKIFLNMVDRLGIIPPDGRPDPETRSAVFHARIEMAEYIDGIIGDDISPAAQKIRAAMRKM